MAMEILTKYFTDFTEKQISQFTALKDLYADWNQKINVISRKDFDNFYLVDSINKKLNVANAVADAIDLKNITVSHTRAEDIHDKKFDIVVSRAVAPLKDLCHWSKPLLKKKPVNEPKKLTGLICLKGGDLNKEMAESGCRPHTWEIEKIFEEDFFKEKYILYVTG